MGLLPAASETLNTSAPTACATLAERAGLGYLAAGHGNLGEFHAFQSALHTNRGGGRNDRDARRAHCVWARRCAGA